VLNLTGFNIERYGIAQPEAVLERMLLWNSLLPLPFWLAAFLLLRLYPLDERRMADIRRQLEARRGRI
jgi:Na+/melibiose symporter-like transporter